MPQSDFDIRFSFKPNPKLKRDVKEESRRRAGLVAQRIQKEAKKNLSVNGNGKPSPAGTPPRKQGGDLQRSVVIRKLRDRKTSVGVFVLSRLRYGAVHEDGEEPYPKRPWLRPAYQKVTANLSSFFKNMI